MSDLVITAAEPATLVITAETTAFLEFSATGLPGAKGADGKDAAGIGPISFSRVGGQYASTGHQRFYQDYDATLLSARISLGTPAQGQDFRVVLVLSTGEQYGLVLAAGDYTASIDIDHAVAAGTYITVDVDQVGTPETGQDLTVSLWMKAAVA